MPEQNMPQGADGASVPNDFVAADPTLPLSDAGASVEPFSQQDGQVSSQPFSNPYLGPEGQPTVVTAPLDSDASQAQPSYAQPTAQMPVQGSVVPDAGVQGAGTAAAGIPVDTPTQPTYPFDASGQPTYQTQATYAQPAYDAYGQPVAMADSPKPATLPLVLGILSIVFAGLLGLVLGIIALVKGNAALKDNPADGRAKGGKITGIVGIVLSALITIAGIGLIAAGGLALSNPDVREAIESGIESSLESDESGDYDLGSLDSLDEDSLDDDMEIATPDTPPSDDQAAALEDAKSYNDTFHMSRQSLYDQLTSAYAENYTPEAAQYAVDNLGVDWKENALKSAQDYAAMDMSKQAIYDQLTGEYGEGFTAEEAQYAMDNVQADWNANALATAKSYLEFMGGDLSTDELREMLVDSEYGDKFTPEEADYAIAHLND